MILFTKGTKLTIFGQLKIPMMFSINLNLKTFRLLNCLHMIFLHCTLCYLIILFLYSKSTWVTGITEITEIPTEITEITMEITEITIEGWGGGRYDTLGWTRIG